VVPKCNIEWSPIHQTNLVILNHENEHAFIYSARNGDLHLVKDSLKLSKSECFIHTRAQYLYTFEISVNAQRDLIASGGRAEIVAQTNALQMPVWFFTFPMSGRSCGGLQSLVCFWFVHSGRQTVKTPMQGIQMKQLLHLPRRSGKVHRSEIGGLTESHLGYLKENK
jgi:hypothetical protein